MIREASLSDAPALLAIYAYYTEQTAVTFEDEVPSLETFKKRMKTVLDRYPYLIYEKDGDILGYAYASRFRDRSAYDWDVETTIYVAPQAKGQGVGRYLYEALEYALSLQNILNANACIAYTDRADDPYLSQDSLRYHEKMGYRWVGEFDKCGYKFKRWYNMVWMEKHLGEHPEEPFPVLHFREIAEIFAERYQ